MTFLRRKMELSEAWWADCQCFLFSVETLITLFLFTCWDHWEAIKTDEFSSFSLLSSPKGSRSISLIWWWSINDHVCSVYLESESAGCVHTNSFLFIDQGDSFKSKIAMFNNKSVKEPPTDPFHTEDPFKSFSGLYRFLYIIVILLMLFCCP